MIVMIKEPGGKSLWLGHWKSKSAISYLILQLY